MGPDYPALVQKLISADPTEREAARLTLYTLDEAAVTPLIDEFYAGVSEAAGLAILAVLAEIGGYEARALFHDVVQHEKRYESWIRVAQTQV